MVVSAAIPRRSWRRRPSWSARVSPRGGGRRRPATLAGIRRPYSDSRGDHAAARWVPRRSGAPTASPRVSGAPTATLVRISCLRRRSQMSDGPPATLGLNMRTGRGV